MWAYVAQELGYSRFEDLGFSPLQVPLLGRLIPLECRIATLIGIILNIFYCA